MKLLAPLEHQPMLAHERERPLLHPKRGAFLYADLRALGRAPERREHRNVGADVDCVIAPVASNHHPPIQIEDPLELQAIKGGDWAPVPGKRERRNDTQALFTLGWGWRADFIAATSLRSSSICCSSSTSLIRAGSQSSPHGVP